MLYPKISLVPLVGVEPTRYRYHGILSKGIFMKNTNAKPSPNYLYVLKFPNYYTTWRLKTITDDGFYIFTTSCGGETRKMDFSRFKFFCRRYVIDVLKLDELKISGYEPSSLKVKITIERSFRSKNYTKDELDSLVDNIDEIEF